MLPHFQIKHFFCLSRILTELINTQEIIRMIESLPFLMIQSNVALTSIVRR